MNTDLYFSPDYMTARRRFRAAASRAGAHLHSLDWGLKGLSGESLTIDIAVLTAASAKLEGDAPAVVESGDAEMPEAIVAERVLLHSSGVHGVEGFAGSAVQLRLLERPPEVPDGCAIVLVHIVNPYGMTFLRRVNENNVDLNRNFLGPEESYDGQPDGYEILDPLFNPNSPHHSWPRFFTLRLIAKLLVHGARRLRQAGAEGQYAKPHGLFFGGRQLERGPELYLQWLQRNLAAARRICGIDVHSGLGRSGDQLIILERNHGADYHRYLADRYPQELDNTGDEPAIVYQVRGGIDAGVPRVFGSDAEVDFVTQEFGTVNGFRVLSTLSAENRLDRFGNGRDLFHPIKRKMKQIFAPSEIEWKRSILEKGERLVADTVEFLFRPDDRRPMTDDRRPMTDDR
ncbi:MAG: M14 family metallopeptidase [bacterium]|nr:M14 family metallopeptidase [bacterium]